MQIKNAARAAWLAVLLPAACSSDNPTSPAPIAVTTPPACPALPAAQGRTLFTRRDLAVANLGGSCRDRGGIQVRLASQGTLDARVEWTDPRAVLRIEVWDGSFFDRLAVGTREGASLCSTASVPLPAGNYLVSVCHDADSQVPLGSSAATPFTINALHP